MQKFPIALFSLLCFSYLAYATEPGDHGFSQFMCHDPDDNGGLALMVDKGADGDLIAAAVDQLLLNGDCAYFAHGMGFTAIKRIDGKGIGEHTVWEVKPDMNDGGKKVWYVLMKEPAA